MITIHYAFVVQLKGKKKKKICSKLKIEIPVCVDDISTQQIGGHLEWWQRETHNEHYQAIR